MGKEGETVVGPREIRILNEAYQDIEEIADFIAIKKQQPLNAIKVARSIWRTIEKIGENPFAFKECEALATKAKLYRRAVCLSWLIIYKITEEELLILGIIHAGRSLETIRKLSKRK